MRHNKEVYNNHLIDIYGTYFNNIYSRLNSAEEYYPNFREWYYQKVLPDIISNNREFLFDIRDSRVVGLSLVKYEEKKLCTLKVFEQYQNRGYGLNLFEKSFEALGTNKPFLTVSEEKHIEFKKIFKYYGFELTSVKTGLYRDNKLEYFFNQKK